MDFSMTFEKLVEQMCEDPMFINATDPMTTTVVKHSYYRIEIDFEESPQHPIVFFRKEGKCKTAKGMERQMNRVTNESCEQWRNYDFRRLTVSRVPAEEVTTPVVN